MATTKTDQGGPRAAAWNETEILVYGDIGASWFSEGVTADRIAEELKAAPRGNTIVVRINSFGGDAFEGVTIYNLLVSDGRKVVTKVDGAAISAASIIAMAGSERRMAENAMLMIHDPWTFAVGNAADMRASADSLDKIADALCKTYERRTGKSYDECRTMMRDETWMTAEEALSDGFATHIDAPADSDSDEALAAVGDVARAQMSRFRKVPENLAQRIAASGKAAQLGTVVRYQFAATGADQVIAAFGGIAARAEQVRTETATTIPPPAEQRGGDNPSPGENDRMDIQEVQAALSKANEELGAVKAKLVSAESERDNEKARAEKAESARAALEAQNDKLVAARDEAEKRAQAAEDRILDTEVDALVGVKIDPHEADNFKALAKKDRALFDRFVAQLPDKTVLSRDPAKMGPEPVAESIQTSGDDNGDEFSRLVNAAAHG